MKSHRRFAIRCAVVGLTLGLSACKSDPSVPIDGTGGTGGIPGTGGAPGTGGNPTATKVQGTVVTAALTSLQQKEVDALSTVLAANAGLTADALQAKRAVPFTASLGYDPKTAVNLPLLAGSALKLNQAESTALGARGFVISERQQFPHFGYAYENIYAADLPVYISADSILEAVHQSYDDILQTLEITALVPELVKLIDGMRAKLPALTGVPTESIKDVDLFLSVGLSLLKDAVAAPVAGASAKEIGDLVKQAKAASGSTDMILFGLERTIDFSQFKPRGHYTGNPILETYFRAMMWLGRTDFPFLHTDDTGKRILVRRSVHTALALRALMDEAGIARYKGIDATIRAFVGEPDSMTPLDVDALKADLGVTDLDLSKVTDDQLAAAIVKGAYGSQRILSQIVMAPPHGGTFPLDATFLFLGQRYVLDSHVFSNVVYDRVNPKGSIPKRMLPDPLDVAYAALGNDQAVGLLADDLKKHAYAPALESMRALSDAHSPDFWEGNLYNLWLSSLRALSPGSDLAAAAGLPAVAKTAAWGRRLLNTQLASWAELRHDTILYAKQSYTSGVACEFPDAYVDPYPKFFGRLEAFAKKGAAVVSQLSVAQDPQVTTRLKTYFLKLAEVTGILREMAELQRTGMPHKPEHLAFINQAVKLNKGCGGPAGITGWYGDLFFSPGEAATFKPVVADVHTAPTDAAGANVGWVLHVGTGWARLMVMTVETCMGPRAYVGAVSSYHQVVTEKLERLTDETWRQRFGPDKHPGYPVWMRDLVTK